MYRRDLLTLLNSISLFSEISATVIDGNEKCNCRLSFKFQSLPVILKSSMKHSDNKPRAYICSKGFFGGLILGRAYFQRGLSLEGILHFKMGGTSQ